MRTGLATRTGNLPVVPVEIELGDSLGHFTVICEKLRARGVGTALVLVRLHTHPLGLVLLNTDKGASSTACAREIRMALGELADSHLAMDGLPLLGSSAANGFHAGSSWPCLHRRSALLAQAPPASVIVATRNRPDSLATCLDSLLRLNYPHYEIIVVDNDPSDDRTASMVRTRYRASSRVHYVREDIRGLASAHNRGVAEASGRILAFTDDDVIVDSEWLAAIAEGFTAADDVGCVTGLILPAELETPAQLLIELHGNFGKGFESCVYHRERDRPADPLFPFTAGRFGSGANMAFDATALHELGGFDPATGAGTFARGGDDLSAFFRVVTRGRHLVYRPDALVWHRHCQELAGVSAQAYGYGVGLGAYLASAMAHEPTMWPALLRRLPAGVAYALRRSSSGIEDRSETWPAEYAAWLKELSRLELRGLLWGPLAYAISRRRTRAERQRTRPTPISAPTSGR